MSAITLRRPIVISPKTQVLPFFADKLARGEYMEIRIDGLRQSLLLTSPNAGLSQVNRPDNRPTQQAVKAINQSELFGHDRELVLAPDPKTRQDIIRIVSKSDGQTIGQIPSESVLQMAAFLQPK